MEGTFEKDTLQEQEIKVEKLGIEVTTDCNSACRHCFARAGISEGSSLPIDIVKKIIGEGYTVGYRNLHITGGEPLLWGGLFEALDYAFKTGFKTVSLNTNGTLLTQDVSKRLGGYDCLSVSVSLEGPETLHRKLRGHGSYQKTVLGIDTALDRGIDLIIFTTVTKSLLPELPHFADDLYMTFPSIDYLTLIQLINVKNNGFALSSELLDPEDFIQLVQIVSLLNLKGLRIIVKNNPLANLVSKLIGMPWLPPAQPLYREGSIVIMANRKINFCHSSRHHFGKYVPGKIQKVLDSRKYQKAVAPGKTICASCSYAELCAENNMIRPSESYWDVQPDLPYCKAVLDRIDQ
jgi:MoaA/NifB/PqqE/SkfB family radical SAM enzyme